MGSSVRLSFGFVTTETCEDWHQVEVFWPDLDLPKMNHRKICDLSWTKASVSFEEALRLQRSRRSLLLRKRLHQYSSCYELTFDVDLPVLLPRSGAG